MEEDKKKVPSVFKRLGKIVLGIIAVIIAFVIGVVVFENTVHAKWNYSLGILDSMYVISLEKNAQTMCASGEITDEQYDNVIRARDNIVNAALNNSNITIGMVKNYNRALRENGISNYWAYQILYGIKRAEGLADGIKFKIYLDDITKIYNDGIISKEEYDTFSKMYDEKEYDEDKIEVVISYAERLLQSAQR